MKAASRSEGPGDTAYWVEGFSEKTKMTQDLDEDGDYSAHAEDEDDTTHARWRALFNFTRQSHTLTLILAIVLSIVSGVIIPATSIFLGLTFNAFTDFGAGQLSGHELLHKVSIQSIALVALGGANWALTGGHFMFWLVFGELQAQSVRDRLFDGLMEKDMSWYDMRKNGVGALIPRLHSQIRELQMATSQPLGFVVQYSVTAAAALGVAFYYSWNLTLVTLATVPFAGLILSFISAGMQPSIEAQQEHLSVASKYASHAISAIDTVKCYNGQDHETWHFACAIRRAARCYLVQARANALQIGFVRLVILSMFVQGFWYGSTLVGPGGKNSGQIVTTFWSALMATQSIEQILPQMLVLEKGRAAGATLKAVGMRIERGRRVTRMAGNFVPSHCRGDIEFRDVSFAYPLRPDRMALQKASFFFPAGETTFVVGQSGSGKSTLGNLLLRYYSGWSGHVAIDGTAIQTLDLTWLRNNVTLVQQQSVLFNESLWTNITFGCKTRLNITRTDVRKACQVALLQHTINDLPDGLETLVGSRGSSMSGGQRQRVAIARARLRDTPILILDESTSALDYVSRSLVMDAIRDWRRGKTTIIITHDMTQVFEDDYVYVLDKGEVSQEGYRGSLEKQAAGPFSRSKKHGSDPRSPTWGDETTQRDSSDMDTQSASIATVPSPPRLSQMSCDSLDIEVAPRRPPVPHVLGDGSDDWPLPRVPLSILSPPPLVTHPGNDMSDMELVELTGRSATLHGRSTSDGLTPISSSRPLNPKSARLNESQNLAKAARAHTKTMSSLKKILGTVWPTLDWKRRIVLLLGFVSAFLHAAATPTFSYLFAQLLATFHAQGNGSQLAVKWSLSVLAVAISDAIFSYLMHYLLEYSAQAWVDMLRIEALKRMLSQPRTWFDDEKNSVSRLSECLDRNAEEMRNLIGRFAGFVFVAFAMTSMAIIWSFIVSWKLTIVGLASAPAMYAVTRGFEFVSGIWEGKSNDAAEAAASIFTETFTSIRVVRALTLERHFRQKYAKATDAALKIGLRRAAYSGLFYGLSGSGILFVMALLFYYGALLASTHQFTITEILTVFSLLIFSIANANATLSFVPQINSSRDTATRLLRLANLPLTSHELRGTTRLVTPLPIILREMSFSYPSRPTHTVLDSLNLQIPPNSTTAIVGPSGSGKTTLASVLLGLHAPTSRPASLTFAHQPCSSVHTGSLRAHIGYVAQAPVLFPGTLASNIAYPLAEPALAQAHVERAARLAGIHDFVASLPAGYATPVLPDGAGSGGGLSGGQAQRVAIARALLRRPRLLLLDEPTSSLDPAAAALVRDALRRLRADRPGLAVVLVTHQPDMMRAADRIVVLERGRIVQVGRWSELMAVHGPFRNMMNRGVWEGGRRRGGEGEGEGGTA